MNTRFAMISDYLDELRQINHEEPMLKHEKEAFYSSLLEDYTSWIDIKDGEIVIGFLTIGQAPNCHPDADYYIEESYIKPAYRRKKYMTHTIMEFVQKHPGTYCLFILNENYGAKLLWERVFGDLGYESCYLKDVGAGDIDCTQYGYKPRQIGIAMEAVD